MAAALCDTCDDGKGVCALRWCPTPPLDHVDVDPLYESRQHQLWLDGIDAAVMAGVDPFTAVTTLDPRNTLPLCQRELEGPGEE
jgi:hypothetical protein